MIFWLAACTQTVHFPDDSYPYVDTGLPTGHSGLVPPDPAPQAPEIQRSTISYGCNGAQTGFLASVRTLGWTGSATMLLVGPTSPERHPLHLEDTATDGGWDRYALGPLLTHSTSTPGQTTALSCIDESEVSWALWITDRIGVPVDCVVWGTDPDEALAALSHESALAAELCVSLGRRP